MEPLRLSELTSAILRRWRLLVLGAGLGLALGVVTGLAVPPRFEAVAVVGVSGTDEVDMVAEESLATSRRVTTEALDALGERGMTIEDVESAVTAHAVAGSRVLRISWASATPALATRGADAVAQAYLAVRSVDAATARDRLGARLEHELRTAEGSDRPALRSERARIALRDTTGGEVIDPARRPRSPTGPGTGGWAAGWTVLGLLAAAGLAALPTIRPGRTRGAPAS